jgi:DNA polymerase I-like protein with 3'-5' exonuclease and polymerase domains
VRRARALLIDLASPVFVQELPTGRWRVVPPADPDALLAAATELGESRGTYWTFNSLPAEHAGTVRVGDVTRRHNLMIDIDPIKVKGHDSDNASDEEHEKTREVAAAIVAELTGLGWPQPAVIDSGNGWNLFYRVDLPNTPHSRSLLKAFLAALAGRHPGAIIDPKVINANRVAKVPGTWARKGPHSADRPHRLCRVVSAPAALEVVTAEQIAAATPGYQRPAPEDGTPAGAPADGRHPDPFRPQVVDGDHGRAYARRALEGECGKLAMAPVGQRNQVYNDAVLKMAGLVAGGHVSREVVEAALKPLARQRGLDDAEVAATWDSAFRAGYARPRHPPGQEGGRPSPGQAQAAPGARRLPRPIPPYVPFPVDVLPAPLADYVAQGAASFGCDPVFVALPVLGVVASAIGNTRVIALKRGWREPSVLWCCVVADSGTVKTPAWRRVTSHWFRAQKRLLQEHRAELAAYEAELAAHQEAKKKAAKAGGGPGAAPEKPAARRVVCSDTTVEKVGVILEANPRGILLARDELNGWFGSFDRYKGKQGGADLSLWLEAFQAGPWLIDRKTGDRPTLYIERAAVSVAGGIQPGVLARALTQDFLDAGGAARLLVAMPVKQPKRWTEAEIDPQAESAYHDLLDRLLALGFAGDAEDGEPVPLALKLSPEAKARWVSFYNSWALEQAAAEGELAAAYSKLEAYAARFALLHHVVSCVGLGVDDHREIGPKSVEAGVRLARWFANEVRRIYATLTESNEERDTRRLVEFVQARGGRLTVKELQRSNSRKYPTAETATAALEALVTAGYGLWEDRVIGPTGGRPTRYFILKTGRAGTDETPRDGDPDGGDAPPPPADDTPPPCDETPSNPEGNEVSSVMARDDSSRNAAPPRPSSGEGRRGASSDGPGVASDGSLPAGPPAESGVGPVMPAYQLVREQAELTSVVQALAESVRVGVDTETTGLNPRTDRVRLLSLATDRGTWLVDCFAVDPGPLWDALSGRPLVCHNGIFDLQFLAPLGFAPNAVHDTMLLSRLLHGTRHTRGFHGLGECAARELGRCLDKAEQKSDWSGQLTRGQLDYAALDAHVLLPLYEALDGKARAAGLAQVAEIERRCLPAVAWLSASGIGFDPAAWSVLAAEATAKAEGLARDLDAAAPSRPGHLMKAGAWNWRSPAQVREAFALLGHSLDSTDDDALAGVDHPLAGLVRQYRSARKLVSTYGPTWAGPALYGGRIYAGWQQVGADSGRMACKAPNLQNLPRNERYRQCFVAPDGRVLVKGDYSQIELRIAARVSGDPAMLDAYLAGQDLHALTAQRVLGVAEVTKEQRQLSKAINFGLLYGMGVKGFRAYAQAQYGLRLTEAEAGRYRDAFFAAYPGLRRWHRSIVNPPIDTRTLAGRRRQGVARYTEKLNTPVQGTGADGLKLALALLWERRAECPGAFPVLAVHDEIVAECDSHQADAVKGWLTRAMTDAMAPLVDPVLVVVETRAGRTWAGDV